MYRAFAERMVIEQSVRPGYDLPHHLFDKWWLQWFWHPKPLSKQRYSVAALSLHFMAAMVEAGDA